MTFFHQVLNQISDAQPSYQLDVPEGWGQGRATFGGLIGALLYQAMRVNVASDRLARSINVSFIGPITPGPVSIEVTTLRSGSAVTQIEARMKQAEQIQCLAIASFGIDRESSLEIPASKAPEAEKPLEKAIEMPYISGLTPEFIQQVKLRWSKGGVPFSNNAENCTEGYMQFQQQTEQLEGVPFDEAVLLCLIDAWPPVQLSKLKKPAPASSLTWSVEFIQPIEGLTSESWLRYYAQIDHSHNGYGQNHAEIWNEQGELLAISRQTVTVFG